ncbi:MAG: hypothetical protein KI790_17515 [Cyclobacteriaceae bacterium]|nr:hypothetical protein [Cyclobacteriaceae bacterium HetDA_MAG_MS6]
MKKLFLLSLVYCFAHAPITAQQQDQRCKVYKPTDQAYFESWLASKRDLSTARVEEIYQIPVVVHVLHFGEPPGEGMNVSDERIHAQIRIVNEDFRRKAGTPGFNEHEDGADAGIEFVLAQRDPKGEPTDGIVRVNMNNVDPPGFGDNQVLAGAYYSMWDPALYLNVWSSPGIPNFGLGFATFPVGDLPGLDHERDWYTPGIDSLSGFPVLEVDGIAINHWHFGESVIDSKYDLGRTGTHELGHFLGLFHTWGHGGFDGSCEIDDYCADTPNISTKTINCPSNKLSCEGTPAMIENYMDYTDDACLNIFTKDQVARMRTVLENSPRRKSLLTSPAIDRPQEDPLNKSPKLIATSIYPNPAKDVVYINIKKQFSGNPMVITLYSITGQIIQSRRCTSSTEPIEYNLPTISDRVILLSVELDGFRQQQRLLLER